jgi:hypothetical protein
MEVSRNKFVDLSDDAADDKEKQKWVEEHARRLQQRFEQWQKPFGIDGAEYHRYLIEQLHDFYSQPLRKSLIESIS